MFGAQLVGEIATQVTKALAPVPLGLCPRLFCGYLMPLSTPNGLFIGNANIRPINPKRYLYHAYLSFMESCGHQHPLSLTAFGQAIPQTLKEYERVLLKRRTNNGIQTNLTLHADSEADCLPASSV